MTGSPLLALLPILSFFLGFALVLGRPGAGKRDWRLAFLLASVAWGCFVTLSSELLTLVDDLALP